MDDRDLDRRVAEALGWTLLTEPLEIGNALFEKTAGVYWIATDGTLATPQRSWGWSPASDLNCCAELEQEIARRGLQHQYATWLLRLLTQGSARIMTNSIEAPPLAGLNGNLTGWDIVWLLTTATASQQARAFLGAMREK